MCFVILNQLEGLDLANKRDDFNKQSMLHYCVFNGHADLLEKLIKQDKGLIECLDEEKNNPFHALCKNSVSCTEDLIYMYNILKQHGCDRKAINKNNKTGLDILQIRIKEENPYDLSLPAIRGFFNAIASTKRKSLLTTKSCPQNNKRFSGISIAQIEARNFS